MTALTRLVQHAAGLGGGGGPCGLPDTRPGATRQSLRIDWFAVTNRARVTPDTIISEGRRPASQTDRLGPITTKET